MGASHSPLGWFFGIYATDYLIKSGFNRSKVFVGLKIHIKSEKWKALNIFSKSLGLNLIYGQNNKSLGQKHRDLATETETETWPSLGVLPRPRPRLPS